MLFGVIPGMNYFIYWTLRKVVIEGVACQLPSSKEVQSPNYIQGQPLGVDTK